MSNKVSVKLKVFIPSEVVTFSLLGYGGTFNGGVKCEPSPTVDLDRNGASSLSFPTPTWGKTKSYSDEDSLEVSGKPDWFRKLKSGANVLQEKRLERTEENLNAKFEVPDDATHGVKFIIIGANPLLSLAPAIDAEIVVGLRKRDTGFEAMVKGSHDGFPSYTIEVNGTGIYSHDCVVESQDPGDLAPPMDFSVNVSWQRI